MSISRHSVLVRPRPSLSRAWLSAALVGGIPFFGALYWLAFENGNWREVLAIQVLAIGLSALIWIRQAAAYTAVTPTQVVKQAFFTRSSVELTDVASVAIITTWRSGSTDYRSEMLIRDSRQHCVMRLGGTFWADDAMEAVADAIGATIIHETVPLSIKEFHQQHPGAAYWFEGRVWVAVVGVVVAFTLAFGVMTLIMHAIGSPSALSF